MREALQIHGAQRAHGRRRRAGPASATSLPAHGAEAGLRDAVAPVPERRGAVAAAAPGAARLRAPPRQLDPRGRLRRRVPLRRASRWRRCVRSTTTARVIYVGTFSKAMFPVAAPGLPGGAAGRCAAISSTPSGRTISARPAIEQAALARFIADGGFERHLRRTWKTLKERRAALLDGLQRCSRGRLQINDSHAGMHLVVWLQGPQRAPQGEAFIARARSLRAGPVSDRVRTTSIRPTAPACCWATARCRWRRSTRRWSCSRPAWTSSRRR